MKIHYLEIVTQDVDGTCDVWEAGEDVRFGEPVADLGNARTTSLPGGGRIGVRAPMREDESPVVRPYVLVEDIAASLDAASLAGAEIAMAPTDIPNRGKFAIFLLGGVEHGLWEL